MVTTQPCYQADRVPAVTNFVCGPCFTLAVHPDSGGCWGVGMIDVGLVGFGFAGRTFHAPVSSAVEGCTWPRYYSGRAPRRSRRIQPLGGPHPRRAARDRLRPSGRDRGAPNPTHFELARQCLLAGRDVVIDKPFTTTYAEAASLVEPRAKASGFSRSTRTAAGTAISAPFKVFSRKAELGRVVLFESGTFDRFRPQLKDNAWRERPRAR